MFPRAIKSCSLASVQDYIWEIELAHVTDKLWMDKEQVNCYYLSTGIGAGVPLLIFPLQILPSQPGWNTSVSMPNVILLAIFSLRLTFLLRWATSIESFLVNRLSLSLSLWSDVCAIDSIGRRRVKRSYYCIDFIQLRGSMPFWHTAWLLTWEELLSRTAKGAIGSLGGLYWTQIALATRWLMRPHLPRAQNEGEERKEKRTSQ